MGKSSIWIAIFMMAAFVTFSACTKHDYPSCTDENVKKIALEKVDEMSKDLYLGRNAPANFKLTQAKGAYANFKERMEKKDEPRRNEIRKLVAAADKFMEKISIDLTDVKLTGTDKKTDTSLCRGTFTFTSKETKKQTPAPINFTAQYTEGHKLKVELK